MGSVRASYPEVEVLAAAFDALPGAVLVADADGSVHAANTAFRSITGYTAEELNAPGLDAILREAARSGQSWRGDWLCPRKSGPGFPARLSVTPISSSGRILLIAEVKAIVRPEASPGERDFDLFFNLIPDLACIAHVDGYYKKVNPAWEKTLGWTAAEVLSRPFLELVHPDDRERTAAEAARQNRTYRTRHFINRYRAKDGSYRLLEWTTTFNRDEQTRFGVARDITEQRKWEASLRESEERFRIMADSCPTIIWVTGADGGIRLTNRTFRQFFGASHDWSLSPAEESPIHPDDREEYAAKFAEAVRERATFRAEARVRRVDGVWRWIASHAEPRLSGSGDYLGHVGISPDITERKEAEQALHDAKLAAEAANRAKGEFLANMSHEIRTPMNAVIGLTDLTLETELAPEQRSYLEGVRTSAESLLRILNDILDFSKIEAGKLEFETVEFDVRRLVESTLKIAALRAVSKELELASDIAPEVPARVLGDPARLRQVLVNLVGNAIKFTECGEVAIRVERLEQTEDAVELRFSIQDTGIGIPPEKLESVFRPFTQADSSTTRRFGGTGLGLTISSQLVELMGGTIRVESEEGRGSTFHFTARFGAVAAEPGEAAAQAHGLLALAVDDNRTSREILGRILSRSGFRTTLADSGGAALNALERAAHNGAPFSLLVLDRGLPDMDGFALLERIQADPTLRSLRIALLNSPFRTGDAARARELGVSIHLAKPVGEIELVEAIRQSTPRNAGAQSDSPLPVSPAPMRILVVEDNAVNRLLAARLLERHGHQVVVATNGQEALDRIGAEAFDCVLMDVQMPVMDGFEATAAIRRKERQSGGSLPVIAMTAHAMAGDLERCMAAGMDGYVTKPVNAAELLAAIDQARGRQGGPATRQT